jgi:DNA-binding NtrC family response regulator
LAYAKEQFEKYHLIAPPSQSEKYNFSWGKTAKQMKAEYEYALQQWAIEKYGSRKETSEKLGVSEKTLNNWKNSYDPAN